MKRISKLLSALTLRLIARLILDMGYIGVKAITLMLVIKL